MKSLHSLFMVIFCVSVLSISVYSQELKEKEDTFTVPSGKVLEANIRGDAGELYVRVNREDNEGLVRAFYEADKYDYDFFFDAEYNELYVSLDKDHLFRDVDIDENKAEIEVYLPKKATTNLDVEFKAGLIELNLTDIPLQNFELNSWAGETVVNFARPNPIRMDYIKVDVNIGEVRVEELGNANFENGFIDGGIGSLNVDLEGEYAPGEYHLRIDLDIGEADISLPRDVGVRMSVSKTPLIGHLTMNRDMRKRGKYYFSRNYEEAEAKLFLSVELGIGECIIR